MSFNVCGKSVKENDVIIVFMGHDSMFPLSVKEGEITQTKYGAIKHNSLLGHGYGTKFSCTKGWVYILQATPELWTLCLPHRTQILYTADIAMITLQLDLKPGSVVCESGTGSGSLSHAILRTVAPMGHLHTVEFNEGRCNKAKAEFGEHGLSQYVTVYHRDVINEGFPVENAADAVFLDIPRPDEAVKVAAKALKTTGGRFCSFSPCIEQTQRTCATLRKPGSGFCEVETLELVRRSHNVKRVYIPIADIGIGDSEVRTALIKGENNTSSVLPCAYEAGDDMPVGEIIIRTTPENKDGLSSSKNPKRAKLDMSSSQISQGGGKSYEKGKTPPAATKYAFSTRTCILPKEIYGHTGYLTFATYRPGLPHKI